MAGVAGEGFEAWRERRRRRWRRHPLLEPRPHSSAVLYELNGKSFMVFWFSVLPPREARRGEAGGTLPLSPLHLPGAAVTGVW